MKLLLALPLLSGLLLLSCKKAPEPTTAAQAARVSPSSVPTSKSPKPAAQAARLSPSPNPLTLAPSPGCGQEAPSVLSPKPEDPPDSCGPK
mgnify:CR=1 FL=1